MPRRFRVLRSILAFGVAALASSAAPAAAHPQKEKDSNEPGAQAPLFDNLGRHHRTITTKSVQAQKYFDQGLNLMFAFNLEEAQRSFEAAAKLDSTCASCWWGVAFSLGPHINLPALPDRTRAAKQAVVRALALESSATDVERALVEALDKRYADPPPDNPEAQKALDTAYADAMRAVMERFPDDLDVAAMYVEAMMDLRPWDLWTQDGQPQPGTLEIVSTLEKILKRDPEHPGANHYYIHAVEASPHPERALASAHRLETLVPAAGHLVHMPGHIYLRTGDYVASERINERAVEADRALFRDFGKTPMYPLMYYTHNLHFISMSSQMAGRYADAMKAAREVQENLAPVMQEKSIPPDLLPFIEMFRPQPLYVMLRFGRWAEVLKEPAPDARLLVNTAIWHAARAIACAAKRDFACADAEKGAFETARGKVPAEAGFGLNLAHDVLNVAGIVMDGRMIEAKGRRDEAIASWQSAVQAADGLSYDEPPDWFYPVRESLGGALLRSGRMQEAEAVFRADLDRNPRNPRSLFGLWKSREAQKKSADAAWVKRQFEASWKNAETTLRVEDL